MYKLAKFLIEFIINKMASFDGNASYSFSNGYVDVDIEKITNKSCLLSGDIRLEVWNLDKPYGEGGFRHCIAGYNFTQPLILGECFPNVKKHLKMERDVTRPHIAFALMTRQGG